MRCTALVLLVFLLGCETRSFDRDKRQIAAKDAIRHQLSPSARHFEIVRFKEDTLAGWSNPLLKRPIRYTLHFTYLDSAQTWQQETGSVLFSPNGQSILAIEIANRP